MTTIGKTHSSLIFKSNEPKKEKLLNEEAEDSQSSNIIRLSLSKVFEKILVVFDVANRFKIMTRHKFEILFFLAEKLLTDLAKLERI